MDPQGIILDDDAGRFVSGDETTCDLCNLLSNAALSCSISESEAQGFELRAFSYLQNGIGVRHTLPGAQDSLLVVITAKNMVIFDETFFDDYGYNGKSYVVLTDDQGNAAELSDQINKMDLIYSNAEATIVAAAGPDETHGGNELLENPAGDSRIARRLVDFFRLIQQYTTRSLTYDSDSLNAAAGMLKILAKRKPSVLAISGLPYVSLPAQDVLIDTQIFIAISWVAHRTSIRSAVRSSLTILQWSDSKSLV
ncbi:hypothetical protein K4K48_007483 [Colletotrichum sp. SAR 10_66]|nr:hypothetical protein K4K48_007483 [Colletotrichum sp. SAR 10_66]